MRIALLAGFLLLFGCSGPPPTTVSDATVDAGPMTPTFSGSTVTGTGLWMTADLTQPNAPRVHVWGQQLGATFGYAFHVALKGSDVAVSEVVVEPALGADATSITGGTGTDRSFGAVRRGPAAGTTVIDTATLLASFTVTAAQAADVRLVIERAQVRRVDGTFVPLQVEGATLQFPGVLR
ncbi:MAG: hypothetical protein Q8L14_40025 [Myxococcales bacterium]|nr:hypothetical protein [Myxococcales bacterium]